MVLKTETLKQAWNLAALIVPVTEDNAAIDDKNLNCKVYYAAGRYGDRVEVFLDRHRMDIYRGGVFHSQIVFGVE